MNTEEPTGQLSIDADIPYYEWHMYEFSPIDHGWETMKTVQEMIATFADNPTGNPAWGHAVGKSGEIATFLAYLESAKTFARRHGWEGDFAVKPRIFSIPDVDGLVFRIGFAFKQHNDGSSFLISPVPLNFFENRRGGVDKKIYFAGKVQKDGWRQRLFGARVMSDGDQFYGVGNGVISYGGPFALSCDHGCYHYGMHALVAPACGSVGSIGPMDQEFELGEHYTDRLTIPRGQDNQLSLNKKQAVDFCFKCISRCQAVVAYIDSLDCYGTLIELGYATAHRLPIYLYISEKLLDDVPSLKKSIINKDVSLQGMAKDELWFLKNLPTVRCVRVGMPHAYNLPSSIFLDE